MIVTVYYYGDIKMDKKILCDRGIRIETASRAKYDGVIKEADDTGVLFVPDSKKFHPAYVTWIDIRKIIFTDGTV